MRKKKWYTIAGAVFLLLFGWFYLILPEKLFNCDYSTVIYSESGELLGATVANDGQWRFPADTLLPEKFVVSLSNFEDRYFFYHPGVNLYSLVRAAWLNLKAGEIVSGGSTISMQLMRLSRKSQSRTYLEKVKELFLATRLELRYSKNQILGLYAAHAPFGGNIVGLQAASWRYFGRKADGLTWAEAATLAVLPNAPSLIHPGKNRHSLLEKRDKLLKTLYERKIISKTDFELALLEPLPEKPYELPHLAPHLLQRIAKNNPKGTIAHTTIDASLQKQVSDLLERQMQNLRANYIFNAAVLVVDVENGNVLSYVGNSKPIKSQDHGNDVDIIMAPRSTGSILKPFLYAASLDAGEFLPAALIPDVPVIIAGYSPKNYSNTYDGAVPAKQALARSLNIPAVFLLREYGVTRFYDLLKKAGMSTLNRSPANYGLSLILGGAEGRLWEICSMYTGMVRSLKYYAQRSDKYTFKDFSKIHFLKENQESDKADITKGIFGAGSIWHTFNAMLEVNKPQEEYGWEHYLSSWKVAWKTGTSFGFRDAWAVGLNSQYVVGVWVGNADGTGRPGLIGVECAAPIMFEVFRNFQKYGWFSMPADDMQQVSVCRKSGYLAAEICTETDSIWVPVAGENSSVCPFHKLISIDKEGLRVTSECEPVFSTQRIPWFVLPPIMETYYKQKNSGYKVLPNFKPGCLNSGEVPMEFIYPNESAKIYLPVNIKETKENVVFKLAHHSPEKNVYWHLNGELAGQTKKKHELTLQPRSGRHILKVIDEDGNTLVRKFWIINK